MARSLKEKEYVIGAWYVVGILARQISKAFACLVLGEPSGAIRLQQQSELGTEKF